jgi:hypothetical protein
VDDATEHIPPMDRTVRRTSQQRHRTLLTTAVMRPSVLVLRNVLGQHPLKVSLVEDEEVVETFLPHGAHPTFGDAFALGA